MPRGRKIVKTIELEECTLASAAEEFYRHNRVKGLALQSQKVYRWYVDGFIKWCGGNVMVSDVTAKDIEDYICKKNDDGIKPVSIASNMVHVRRFFNFCTERGYTDGVEIIIPKYEVELKDPYTENEMGALLKKPVTKNWVEYRNWVMVNYFFSTGQRLSTVLNIKVSHMDLEHGQVKLAWNKDKIQKYMPLSSALIKVLKEYIEVSDLQQQDYLFPEYEGKQLKKRSAEDAIADYNRSRGVSKTSIHLFRHTFAKNFIVNGGNPAKLQKLMNHKTIEQTMKYVNLYGIDVGKDIDLYNPLDVFKRNAGKQIKRKTVSGVREG